MYCQSNLQLQTLEIDFKTTIFILGYVEQKGFDIDEKVCNVKEVDEYN